MEKTKIIYLRTENMVNYYKLSKRRDFTSYETKNTFYGN